MDFEFRRKKMRVGKKEEEKNTAADLRIDWILI